MTSDPLPILGIIGPPCSGKSTVAGILQSRGGVWINADVIAKEQLGEPEVIEELVALFGAGILGHNPQLPDSSRSEPSLSRSAIANLVFGDDEESVRRLRQLESILHPRTRREIERQIQQSNEIADHDDRLKLIVLDVPLLIESGWDARCDEVWCLKISPDRHAALLAVRGWTSDELTRRQRRQLSWSEKEARSTRIIENDGSLDQLERQVIEGLSRLLST
ncbi:dephospho-CoA kinase [Neorhodopirellula pilleata]|uniref:Dephospho-CoA kinase n=1 Tax=Neorhodopirellula pilleata TaxID=2714738 RepID=A0A5C6A765_9BACT|nr:dephospho-CoA kinase [Neorhodopirellula pilleata]TWT94193.1 Dephospho-CoA kinase [Neorhodopirellula pilleata]